MAFIPTVQIAGGRSSHGGSAFISTSSPLRFCSFRAGKPCVLRRTFHCVGPTRMVPAMSAVQVKTHEVFMPALSSTMSEGRIVQWLKQPGDPVEVGEPIMVVESDKADMDVESFEKGFLASILVEEGDSCEVGATVGLIVANKEDIDVVASSAAAAAPTRPPPVAPASTDPSSDAPATAAPATGAAAPSPPSAKPDLAEIFMPALSSTMTEGKIVQWLKNEGDSIAQGETVMVVESDKADMDVESFEDGFLAHISVAEDESSPVGDAVAYLAKSEADIPVVKAWASAQASGSRPEGTPASSEPAPAPVDPTPAKPSASAAAPVAVVNEGRIVASPRAKAVAKELGVDLRMVPGTGPGGRIVEADVVKMKESGIGSGTTVPAPPSFVVPKGKVVATPEAKKIAKKEKIDLSAVSGTGNFGRITADDVLKATGKAPVSKPVPSQTTDSSRVPTPVASTRSEGAAAAAPAAGSVAMSAMQKAVVQNMNASLSVPVFRITYKIKTEALDDLYAQVKPKGVTMSALLAKAVAITLSKHPIMNAAYAENAIVYRPEINVAMAVAMNDGGLVTPTLKDADKLDLYSLSRNWKDLVTRALDKKLSPDEYSSGTFFVSNLGMLGVEQFDAILPPGAPGILAIGASKPVVGMQSNGLIGVEKEMSVTLTADHRHIYGADGAKFLRDLAALIEGNVMTLLM